MRAPAIPTQKVEAIAIEKASWMPWTMFGISGWTIGLAASGDAARMRAAEIARAGQVERAAAGSAARELGRRTAAARRPSTSWVGISVVIAVREDRTRERQPDGPADLLEERQAARRDADPVGRDGVLDDQREDRERRPDPEAGQGHPQPQRRVGPCRLAGSSTGTGRLRAATASRTSGTCSGRPGRRSGPRRSR